MVTPRTALLAAVLIVCLGQDLREHADAACFDCLEGLFQPNETNTIVLTDDVLNREYRQVDEKLLSEAIEVIDKHLRRHVDTSSAVHNFDEVRALIQNELEEKYKTGAPPDDGESWWRRWLTGRRCLSDQLASKSRDVMLNALIRLLRLGEIGVTSKVCQDRVTKQLAEFNRIAKDSIGRGRTGRPLLPRVDFILFNSALRRAQKCLPRYQSRLRALYGSPTTALVDEFWSLILEHRFKAPNYRARLGTSQLDAIFQQDPRGALKLIENMPYAIEEDEVDIVKQFVTTADSASAPDQDGSAGAPQQAGRNSVPCSSFMLLAEETVNALDFDLQLGPFIFPKLMEAFLRDVQVHRIKAYYLMCGKLLAQAERNLKLLAPDEQ